MELASGYSDSINYGNGYTPLATGAINNNNANYAANQEYARLMGQYNPFAQSGGFGAMTDYYSNAGAAYGRATGGFGGYGAANADPFTPVQSGYPSGNVQRGPDLQNLSVDPFAQPQAANPTVDWSKYFSETVAPNQSNFNPNTGYNQGDNAYNPSIYSGLTAGGFQPMGNPNAQKLLGYDPRGGDGAFAPSYNAGGGLDPNNQSNIAEYYRLMSGGYGQGGYTPQTPSQTQTPAPFGGPDTNLYGYPSSGSLGTMNPFGGYQPDTQSGKGGIGSDALRDQFAWQLAQSSPFATPGAPANGPYPNLGYNPGMANSFANPAMQQYDWTKNNATLQQQMQDALKTIDGATGQKPAEPYGGKLPDFWQGVRDWTGMGAPQPIWQPSS